MNATATPQLTDAEMRTLLDIAAISIRAAVIDGRSWRPSPSDHHGRLREPGAAFVTLHAGGHLRGCVGTLTAALPLVVTVADRARNAALADPRFPPVEPFELPALHIDVAVLSSPAAMDVDSYRALLDAVRPGVDGLVVEAGAHRATLLPAVWADLPTAPEFLAALWRKAGLEPAAWPRDIVVARYTAQRAGRALEPADRLTPAWPRPS